MKAKWTFMVFIAGDNDLDPAALKDIAEMAKVGSSGDLQIVVQLDRAKDRKTRRFHITKDGGYEKDCVETFKETNTGDPKVLEDFVIWGMDRHARAWDRPIFQAYMFDPLEVRFLL